LFRELNTSTHQPLIVLPQIIAWTCELRALTDFTISARAS